MDTLPWIILLLPLFSAEGITIFTQKNRDLSAKISIGAVSIGFVLSFILFLSYRGEAIPTQQVPWINVGTLGIDIGIQLDAISQMMLLIVMEPIASACMRCF